MYSVYGDTVCDPFWGTGTTAIAAMAAARNSVGYEVESGFVSEFDERADALPELSRSVQAGRLRDHRSFVEERRDEGEEPGHAAERYGFPVVTRQESRIVLYAVDELDARGKRYVATYTPVDLPGDG